jgi:hypothetical protein
MSWPLNPICSARIAEGFDDIATEQIIEENDDVLYDSWDHDVYNCILDLDALPLVDDNGNEIRIYNGEGEHVSHRLAVMDLSQPTCGVLLNLSTCEALFNLDPSMLDDGEPPIHLSIYPQAYLQSVGHVQANGILLDFQRIVNQLNAEITHPAEESNDNEDNEHDQNP